MHQCANLVPPCILAHMKTVKGPSKSNARGVVFEDVIPVDLTDEDEPKTKIALQKNPK